MCRCQYEVRAGLVDRRPALSLTYTTITTMDRQSHTTQLRAQLEAAGNGQAQLSAAGAEVTALKEAQAALQKKADALKAERDEAEEVGKTGGMVVVQCMCVRVGVVCASLGHNHDHLTPTTPNHPNTNPTQRANRAADAVEALEAELEGLRGSASSGAAAGEDVEGLKAALEAAKGAEAEMRAEVRCIRVCMVCYFDGPRWLMLTDSGRRPTNHHQASQLQVRQKRLQQEVEALREEVTRARDEAERAEADKGRLAAEVKAVKVGGR